MPRAHIAAPMRARAAPDTRENPRAGDSPHRAAPLQPSCVSCARSAASARSGHAGLLAARLAELVIEIPRAPPTRHQGAAERIYNGPETGAKNTPNIAKYRSFQRFASLSDGPPLSSSGARQITPQAVESMAVSRSAAGAASARRHARVARRRQASRTRAAAPAQPPPRLRVPCRPAMRSCSGVAAILTVASAHQRRDRRIRAPRRTLRHPGRRGTP